MPSTFFQTAKTAFLNILWILMPLLLMALFLEIDSLGVFEKLGITLLLSIVEGYVLYKVALPWLSQFFSELLLSQTDIADGDQTLEAARRLIREGRNRDASKMLEQYTLENPGRIKSWILRVDFLVHDTGDYREALDALKEGMQARRWNKQDKAFFLYRIGKIHADYLNQPQSAREYWQEAASKYPRTAYGRESIKKLATGR